VKAKQVWYLLFSLLFVCHNEKIAESPFFLFSSPPLPSPLPFTYSIIYLFQLR
jgi:hypothetical protein